MEYESEGNENKMILGEFNCTINKMDRDDGKMWFQLCPVETHRR